MQKTFLVVVSFVGLASCNPETIDPPTPTPPSFESCDEGFEFDNHIYSTIQIGDQCWFAENLRTEHYANGDAIAGELNDEMWENADFTYSGAQAIYVNNSSYLATYGRLYNWHAINDNRGLCPSGWRIPSDEDFMTLEMELGMSESEVNETGSRGTNQGLQMKTSFLWGDGGGSNSSGFSALPGGIRQAYGDYSSLGYDAVFWTATVDSTNNIWECYYRRLTSSDDDVERDFDEPGRGFSVRCVRD